MYQKSPSRLAWALQARACSRRRRQGRPQLLHSSAKSLSSLLVPNDKRKTETDHQAAPFDRIFSSLSKEAATGAPDAPLVSRWWAVPPANAVHLSIGSVYVYSMWTPGMTHATGVVSAAAADWTHGQVLPVFSASAVCLGLTASSFVVGLLLLAFELSRDALSYACIRLSV
jgi:hypothetical protein